MFEVIKKERTISYEDEIIENCWICKDFKQLNKENNYFKDTRISQNILISGIDKNLLNKLNDSIDRSNEMICITSYIFSEPDIKRHLLKASKRGIRVYMLTASNKHLKERPDEDDDFNKRMYIEMDNLFNELQGKIKIRTSENFHTKFLLIDPLNPVTRKGFLLTSNFDTKGLKGRIINDRLKVNPEICIRLSNQEIIDFFNQFCYGFWIESTGESKIDGFFPIKSQLNKDFKLKNVIFNSREYHHLDKAIIDLITNHPGKLIICTYGISTDNIIFKKIIDELKSGREVIILTRPRDKNMPALLELIEKGAIVYGHDDIHAKVILIENHRDIKGILMTANIENISFSTSFESAKILNRDEAQAILKILENWIKNFPLVLKNTCSKKDIKGEIRIWNSYKSELEKKEIIEVFTVEIETDNLSKSIENYYDSKIPERNFKKPNNDKKIYKKIKYKYKIVPPTLPIKAKKFEIEDKSEVNKNLKNNNLPIYKLKDKFYIVIKDPSQIENAKRLAKKYANSEIVTLKKYISNL